MPDSIYSSSNSSLGIGALQSGEQENHITGADESPGLFQGRKVRMTVPDSRSSSSRGNHENGSQHEVQSLRQQLQAERSKREEIEARLMAAQAQGHGGNAELQQRLMEAQKKNRDLTDEIQRLLTEKVSMQTEISQLRFQLAGKAASDVSPGEGGRGGGDSFETSRQLAKCQAELREKERELDHLRDRLMNLQEENERLRKIIGDHNDQVTSALISDAKKKKKGWWGGKKPSKPALSPVMIITEDGPEIDDTGPPTISITPVPDGKKSKSEAAVIAQAQAANINKLNHRWHEKIQALNDRIMELEREKARTEAENALLEKERRTLGDQASRQNAIIDSLKAQQKVWQDPDRIPSTKSIMIALPPGGGTDADRWKTVVQMQEAALRKTAIQKEELQRQLNTLATVHGNNMNAGHQRDAEMIQSLQGEVTMQSRTIAELKKTNAEHQLSMHEGRLKEKYWMAEITKYKTALKDLDELLRDKTRKQDKQHDAFVAMLGAALADNEVLFARNAQQTHQHQEDIAVLHGETLALRQGRVGRMKGDTPTKAVFPSPGTDMMVFRAPQSLRELSTTSSTSSVNRSTSNRRSPSTSSSSTTSSSSPLSSPAAEKVTEAPLPDPNRRYFYEWVGGAYILRHGPARSSSLAGRDKSQAGPFPADRAEEVMVDPAMKETLERDRATAAAALRNWNAAPPPPLPRPISVPPLHQARCSSSSITERDDDRIHLALSGSISNVTSRRRRSSPSHKDRKGKETRPNTRSHPIELPGPGPSRLDQPRISGHNLKPVTNHAFIRNGNQSLRDQPRPTSVAYEPETKQPIHISIMHVPPDPLSTSPSSASRVRSTTDLPAVSPRQIDSIPLYEVTGVTHHGVSSSPSATNKNPVDTFPTLAAGSGLPRRNSQRSPPPLIATDGIFTAQTSSRVELSVSDLPIVAMGSTDSAERRYLQSVELNKVIDDDEIENLLGSVRARPLENLFGPRPKRDTSGPSVTNSSTNGVKPTSPMESEHLLGSSADPVGNTADLLPRRRLDSSGSSFVSRRNPGEELASGIRGRQLRADSDGADPRKYSLGSGTRGRRLRDNSGTTRKLETHPDD